MTGGIIYLVLAFLAKSFWAAYDGSLVIEQSAGFKGFNTGI